MHDRASKLHVCSVCILKKTVYTHICTLMHTYAHTRTQTHINMHTRTHKCTHTGVLLVARQVSVRQRPICGRSSERAAGQLQLLTSSAAMRELKVVIFMVRRFVFMHPAIHPATHAPGHPSVYAIILPSVHASVQPSMLSHRVVTTPASTRSWLKWGTSLVSQAPVSKRSLKRSQVLYESTVAS